MKAGQKAAKNWYSFWGTMAGLREHWSGEWNYYQLAAGSMSNVHYLQNHCSSDALFWKISIIWDAS